MVLKLQRLSCWKALFLLKAVELGVCGFGSGRCGTGAVFRSAWCALAGVLLPVLAYCFWWFLVAVGITEADIDLYFSFKA